MFAALISSVLSGEAVDGLRRARLAAIVYAIAGILAFCGVGFLLGAAYMAAAARFGSFNAAIGFGIGFLVIAMLMVFVHRVVSASRARRAAARRRTEMKALAGAATLAALPSLLAGKGRVIGLLVPAAAAVAYAIYQERRPRRHDDIGTPPPG